MSNAKNQFLPANSCRESVCNLTSASSEIISEQEISAYQSLHTTALAFECKRKHLVIPHNVILGHIRPIQDIDFQVYDDAVENTALILADSWIGWAKGQAAL